MRFMRIIITVDTEGDNLWDQKDCKNIETKNALWLSPFQNLCEKYKYYPVYLVNYEMAMSDNFCDFAKNKVSNGLCEIGMHLHAWNSPPFYALGKKYSGNAYITEYPKDIIYEKHKLLMDLIIKNIGVKPQSYRAGRWATNNNLFDVLEALGFLVDCSVTPGINHRFCGQTIRHSNNYRFASDRPYKLREKLIEVPMTTVVKHSLNGNSVLRKLKNVSIGEKLWLRPALQDIDTMKLIIDEKKGSDYIMFMIHSSELMPKGSPYCQTEQDVDFLLNKLDTAFNYATNFGEGVLLENYYHECRSKL